MNKRLLTFLKISVGCLIVIAIIVFASYNFTLINQNNDTKTSTEDTANNSSSSQEHSSASSDSALSTENGDSEISDPFVNPDDSDGSANPDDSSSDSSDSENEPALPDATPEPDMDPDTWDYIKGGDYNMIYTDKEKAPEVMPYEIRVNKQMNCITIYKANKKGKYTKAVKAMVCSAGSATPLGTFKTSDKYYWKAMIHGVWAQYATRITGKILFHSVPYDTHEKDTLITNYYNQLGRTASAGCVRLAAADAKWISENCPSGTPVVIYNSRDAGELGKPEPIRIPYNCTWDPTDPDTRNPWNSKETTITGVKDRRIERGSHVNYLQGVTAYDIFSNKMSSDSIKVSTKLNSSKPGAYKVKYSYTDSNGGTVKEKAVFTVVDTEAPKITGIPAEYYVKNSDSITIDALTKKVKLTDNGQSLDKDTHLSITISGDTATLTARDDYGHTTVFKSKVIKDDEAPVLKIDSPIEKPLPLSKTVDEKWARKRISRVSDNEAKLSAKDVSIKVQKSGWGMSITYSVKDKAGNVTSTSEKVSFETASIVIDSSNLIIDNIKDNDELESLIALKSDTTGKDTDYKLKINRKKTGEDEQYKTYLVTYHTTYKSSAGSKTAVNSVTVNVKK